jgi:nitroreductase
MIKDLLLQRFAVKAFEPGYVIATEDLHEIIEAARLSCSSVNSQPWHITVVTNPSLRQQLREISYGQSQVTDASVLLILSVMKDPSSRIQKTADLIARGAGQDSADAYLRMTKGSIPQDEAMRIAWMQRQSYLALQAMILAAIERGIDSCPMEGFQPAACADILQRTDIVPTAFLALGKAAKPGFAKIRVPVEDIVEYRP